MAAPKADASSRLAALSPATRVVAAGRPELVADGPLNPPIVLSSTFHAGGPIGYGREGNSTWEALEAAVAALEGGRARAFASGMAAVTAVLDDVPAGALVVAPVAAYAGVLGQLRRLQSAGRLAVRLVDITDTDAVREAVRGAALLWVESPTNPLLGVADIPALVLAAQGAGARVVVDNTFATPLLQRPLSVGADVVVLSATKYVSGHSDVLLGLTVTNDEDLHSRLTLTRTLGGAIPGPLESWLVLRGLRTLHLRMERSQASAMVLAKRLAEHPAVDRVRYPGLPHDPGHDRAKAQMDGFGAMVSIDVVGDADTAERACSATGVWAYATSLGGVESSLERRRRWPSESLLVPETLVRLSVGIEDVEDLWRDLDQALRSATGGPAG
jgi:cystathionine gamma-synthase